MDLFVSLMEIFGLALLSVFFWWLGDVAAAYGVYGQCDWRWGCLRRARDAYYARRHSAFGRSASLREGAAMIYSDKQYGVSSAQLVKLRDALAAADARASDQAWLKQAEIDGLKSQIADIEAELAEYDISAVNFGRPRK